MTTTQTQIRRDTATNLNAATPASGEFGYDTTNKRPVIGDGSTLGGIKIPNAKDIQNQTFEYGTVGGTANAITLTNSPVVAAYTNGLRLRFKATSSNSGATTVNVDSLGAKNIYKLSSGVLGALASGDIISGAIYTIVYDGTQFQLLGAVAGGVVSVKKQIFTASGTYTPSSGMLYCIAEVVGGGGGGGGAGSGGSSTTCGGGGGAGAYGRSVITAATIGASQVVTIGAAGAAGSGATGGTGGTSSLGSLISCTGGAGGVRGNTGAYALGGVGGTATNADLNITGAPGGKTLGNAYGGQGANTLYGAGGIEKLSAGAGNAGSGYGAGGGGSFSTFDGAAGQAGVIIITEYCSVA